MLYNYNPSNNYVRGTAYPKTPQLVLQPSHHLPLMLVTGAGTPVMGQIRPTNGRQVNFRQAVPMNGYGGLSAGMLYGYPLAKNGLGQPIE